MGTCGYRKNNTEQIIDKSFIDINNLNLHLIIDTIACKYCDAIKKGVYQNHEIKTIHDLLSFVSEKEVENYCYVKSHVISYYDTKQTLMSKSETGAIGIIAEFISIKKEDNRYIYDGEYEYKYTPFLKGNVSDIPKSKYTGHYLVPNVESMIINFMPYIRYLPKTEVENTANFSETDYQRLFNKLFLQPECFIKHISTINIETNYVETKTTECPQLIEAIRRKIIILNDEYSKIIEKNKSDVNRRLESRPEKLQLIKNHHMKINKISSILTDVLKTVEYLRQKQQNQCISNEKIDSEKYNKLEHVILEYLKQASNLEISIYKHKFAVDILESTFVSNDDKINSINTEIKHLENAISNGEIFLECTKSTINL